jgi:hypothetical protein
MKPVRTLLATASLLLATPASAQVGFTFAGRLGISVPYGDAYRTATGATVAVAGNSTASLPFQLDVGVTVAKKYFIGAYGQYRYSLLKSGVCPAGLSCSETGARAGAEFIYTTATSGAGIAGWIGLGSGWEWSMSRGSLTNTSATVTLSGWEFAQLQLGVDAWVSNLARVGIYVSGSLGQFSRASASDDSGSASGSIASRTLHGWFELGMKSTFDL